jgi:hypothetical protein
MPLWKLQTVGDLSLDFLYPNVGKGTAITLRPGVACCLRAFYGLITDLVRAPRTCCTLVLAARTPHG